MRVVAQAPAPELSEHAACRAQKPGRLLRWAERAVLPRGPEAEAALVTDRLADARRAAQTLHARLSPAARASRVLVHEVPPAGKLQAVDLRCELQQHTALHHAPLDLLGAHALVVEALVQLAESRARRTADDEVRLLRPHPRQRFAPVSRQQKVPAAAVGVSAQVEGQPLAQRHAGAKERRHPRHTEELGDLRLAFHSGRAAHEQELVQLRRLQLQLRRELR